MRSDKERAAEVKRRIAERERERKQRRGRLVTAAAAAACLAMIVGLSLLLPGMAGQESGGYQGFAGAASIFCDSEALGYVVIGLLAFLLGVCVTILCFRLRQMEQEDRREENEDGHERGAD